MRRVLLLLAVLSLFVMTNSCGGGGSSSGSVGTSDVTVKVGDSGGSASLTIQKSSLLARAERFFRSIVGSSPAIAGIPSDVTHVIFTISAPDMVTITRDVAVAGQDVITETFTVTNGNNRLFKVEAKNASDDVVYSGQIPANLNGQPVTLTINMEDVYPPTFKGPVNAQAASTTQINISWDPAFDSGTKTITYTIYRATIRGEEDFSKPIGTVSGGTSYSATGLEPATTYYFRVRATDGSGNYTDNESEAEAKTLTPPDTEAPGFNGIRDAQFSRESGIVRLSWNAAEDNVSLPKDIRYPIYQATTSGGQNFSDATYVTDPGATEYSISGLPDGTYYFVVRARDEAGNTSQTTVEKAVKVDFTPPTIETVEPTDGAEIAPSDSFSITVTFSEPMDTSTVTSSSLYLSVGRRDENGPKVAGTITAGSDETTFTFQPSNSLSLGTYTATVTTGVTDSAGNHLNTEKVWEFYIEAAE